MFYFPKKYLLTIGLLACCIVIDSNAILAQQCGIYYNFTNNMGSVSASPLAPVSVAYSCAPGFGCGPTYVSSGCTDPGAIRFKGEVTAPFTLPGEGIRITSYIGIIPQHTFLAGQTYQVTMSVKVGNGSGNFTNTELVLRAASAAQTSGACAGSCQVIGTIPISPSCASVIATITPALNYEHLFISATGEFVNGQEVLWVEIDDVCVQQQSTPDCPEPQFSYEPEPCGNYTFFNTSGGDPGLSSLTWNFSGPGFPSGGVNQIGDGVNVSFPQSGTYIVTMCGQCAPFPDQVCVSDTIVVVLDETPPTIQNCPAGSQLVTLLPPCVYPFTVPQIGAGDENGIAGSTYLYNGNPVSPAAVLNLGVGIHQFLYTVTDNCGNSASCQFAVRVECENPNNCDYTVTSAGTPEINASGTTITFTNINGNGPDERAWYNIGLQGNNWKAEFDLNITNIGANGGAIIPFAMVAGNSQFSCYPTLCSVDALGVQVWTPPSAQSPIWIAPYIKDDNTHFPYPCSYQLNPNQSYSIRLERINATQAKLTVLSGGSAVWDCCFDIPQTINGLNTAQLSNLQIAWAARQISGTISKVCALTPSTAECITDTCIVVVKDSVYCEGDQVKVVLTIQNNGNLHVNSLQMNAGSATVIPAIMNISIPAGQTVTTPPFMLSGTGVVAGQDICYSIDAFAAANGQQALNCATNIIDNCITIPPCDSIADGPCTNFNDQDPLEWGVYNNSNGFVTFNQGATVVGSPGQSGPGDFYLQFSDISGGTWAMDQVSYDGDWRDYYGQCFCYDYKLLDDSNPAVLSVKPRFYIFGTFDATQPIVWGSNPVVAAYWEPNANVTEQDGWNTFCAPLDACTGTNTLPSSPNGQWIIPPGVVNDCNTWNTLMSNVQAIATVLDVTANPAEDIQIDNICIEPCPADLCDSVMVMVDTAAISCFDPSIITGNPCISIFQPVCGCNGITYSNSCVARENGITTWVPGECSPQNPAPVVGDCCYTLDLKVLPEGFAYVCFDMLTPGVIFNSAMIQAAGLQLDTNATGTQICIRDAVPGRPRLTPGFYNDFLKLCLGNVQDSTQYPQCVEVTYWVPGPVDIPLVACRDTLKFYCEPPATGDTCSTLEVTDVDCDPNDPLVYTMEFTVCNVSGFTASQVVLASTDPNIKFRPCGTTFAPATTIGVPLAALASGSCATNLCVEVVSTSPVTSLYQFCMNMTLWNSTMCCTAPDSTCVTLEPCCDPCETNPITVSSLQFIGIPPQQQPECCASITFENECAENYFTMLEIVSGTPGVIFGSHFTNGADAANWNVVKTLPTCVQWQHNSGFVPVGTYSSLINYCLDDIDAGETPQVVYLNWYALGPNGEPVVVCTDTIVTECDTTDNKCIGVIDLMTNDDPCDPNFNGTLNYNLTIQNQSQPPHSATALMMNSVTPGVSVFPNNFPFSPALPHLGVTTVNFNVFGPGVVPGAVIKIEVRLSDGSASDDWCCFESDTICIIVPSCWDCEDVLAIAEPLHQVPNPNPCCWFIHLVNNAPADSISSVVFETADGSPITFTDLMAPGYASTLGINFIELTHSSGSIPNGFIPQLYSYCIPSGTNTEIYIYWKNQDGVVVCIDTLRFECPEDPDPPCGEISYQPGNSGANGGQCCWDLLLTNPASATTYQQVLIETDGSSVINYTAPGMPWIVTPIGSPNPNSALLISHTSGFIPTGTSLPFLNFCLSEGTSNIYYSSWITAQNRIRCRDTFEFSCPQDSFNCDSIKVFASHIGGPVGLDTCYFNITIDNNNPVGTISSFTMTSNQSFGVINERTGWDAADIGIIPNGLVWLVTHTSGGIPSENNIYTICIPPGQSQTIYFNFGNNCVDSLVLGCPPIPINCDSLELTLNPLFSIGDNPCSFSLSVANNHLPGVVDNMSFTGSMPFQFNPVSGSGWVLSPPGGFAGGTNASGTVPVGSTIPFTFEVVSGQSLTILVQYFDANFNVVCTDSVTATCPLWPNDPICDSISLDLDYVTTQGADTCGIMLVFNNPNPVGALTQVEFSSTTLMNFAPVAGSGWTLSPASGPALLITATSPIPTGSTTPFVLYVPAGSSQTVQVRYNSNMGNLICGESITFTCDSTADNNCDPDCFVDPQLGINLNTGYQEEISTVIPAVGIDNDWTLISAPDPGLLLPMPAFVIGQQSAAWATFPNSNWISAYPYAYQNAANLPPAAPYVFERCFDVCDSSTLTINASAHADNDLVLNLRDAANNLLGTVLNIPFSSGIAAFTNPPSTGILTVTVAAGEYCLEAELRNTDAQSRMGFNLTASVKGEHLVQDSCKTNPSNAIVGEKYWDKNCNGQRDNVVIEPGLAGWVIELRDPITNNLIATTTTNSNGTWAFVNIAAGTYVINEVQQVPWVQTEPNSPTTHTLTIGSFNALGIYRFGNCRDTTPPCDYDVVLDPVTSPNDTCCWAVDIVNNVTNPNVLIKVQFSSSNGKPFSVMGLNPAFNVVQLDPQNVEITPVGGGLFPTGIITDVFKICIAEADSPATIDVFYEKPGNRFCKDSLSLSCPIPTPCPIFSNSDLNCNDGQLEYCFTVTNPGDTPISVPVALSAPNATFTPTQVLVSVPANGSANFCVDLSGTPPAEGDTLCVTHLRINADSTTTACFDTCLIVPPCDSVATSEGCVYILGDDFECADGAVKYRFYLKNGTKQPVRSIVLIPQNSSIEVVPDEIVLPGTGLLPGQTGGPYTLDLMGAVTPGSLFCYVVEVRDQAQSNNPTFVHRDTISAGCRGIPACPQTLCLTPTASVLSCEPIGRLYYDFTVSNPDSSGMSLSEIYLHFPNSNDTSKFFVDPIALSPALAPGQSRTLRVEVFKWGNFKLGDNMCFGMIGTTNTLGTAHANPVLCDTTCLALPLCACGEVCYECCTNEDLQLPTGLSPNGDNLNDVYIVNSGNKLCPVEMRVYNRWGNLVWKEDNTYANNWAGTNQAGENLPEGTYYVLMRIKATGQTLTNFVDLKRQ